MKILGIIGGMGIESTLTYYREIGALFQKRLGGYHSPQLLIGSVDFQSVSTLQHEGKWEELGSLIASWRDRLLNGGATRYLISSNTMHFVALKQDSKLFHIVDAVGEEVTSTGVKTVGLLGTKFTLESGFYAEKLANEWGVATILPEKNEIDTIHSIIYSELCRGLIKSESILAAKRIVDTLLMRGAESVVLACTELGMLFPRGTSSSTILDSTLIHAQKAGEWLIDGLLLHNSPEGGSHAA